MSEPLLHRTDALTLAEAGGPSVSRLLPLLQHFGGLDRLLRQNDTTLLTFPGIGPETVRRIRASRRLDPERIETQLRRREVMALVYGEPGYPGVLTQEVNCPPLVLYVRGDPAALGRPGVAIVGTRRPTPGGEQFTRRLASDLAACDLTIVSGLATGIDGCAHRSALEQKGITTAVLAHGLATVHPSGHRDLARRIVDSGGALVSEYPLKVSPGRHTFVPRNRIVAGLSVAVVVVEGGRESGARHTAHFGNEYQRVVLAVPGRPQDPMAALPNQMLRDREAEVCRGAEDVLASLRPDQVPGVRRAIDLRAGVLVRQAERALRNLGEPARLLMDHIGTDPVDVDRLCERSGLPASEALALLLQMEIEGLVEQLPGLRYLAVLRKPPSAAALQGTGPGGGGRLPTDPVTNRSQIRS
jgi:DNA processing protein